MNIKGLSSIVTTMLLVLLTVVATGTLYSLIKTTVSDPLSSPQFNCLNLQLNPPVTIQYACINSKTNDIEVKLKRESDLEINSLSFLLISDKGETPFSCGKSCSQCIILDSLDTKTYLLNPQNSLSQNSIKLYTYSCLIGEKTISNC